MNPQELALAHLKAMSTGDPMLAAKAIHPQHVNYMAPTHPPASALLGLPGFMATSAWLRSAFADLHFDVNDIVTEENRTIAYVTMTGRQEGPFVLFPPGQSPLVFPPTGRPFAANAAHIFTIQDGLHLDHRAVRDDMTMMNQLGHLPPGPAVAARMARFGISGGRRRAIANAIDLAQLAADGAPQLTKK